MHTLLTIMQVGCGETMHVTLSPHGTSGTVYFQTTEPFLVMSGFCVYSVASALFMFPALYAFHTQALSLYTFEHADGAGRATDLVIQPFVRFSSMAFLPVIVCAGVLYLLVSSIIDRVIIAQPPRECMLLFSLAPVGGYHSLGPG